MSESRVKYLELIHAEIDGEASDKELAALQEYLASDHEAQKLRAALAKLNNVLNQVEEVETPADLHTSILTALPPRRPALEIVAQNSSPWRLRIPFIRYGYTLAAGLLLGAVLTGVALKNLSPPEKSDIYGTLAVRENAQRYVAVEHMNLDFPVLRGSVELSRSGSNSMMVFDLYGQQAVEVEVGFDGSQAGLMSFNQQLGAIRSFQVKEGTISFQSEGKQRSTVVLASKKHAQLLLNLSFYVGGKLVHQGTLGGAARAGSGK
ncbi:MAG: hypothetical protein DMG49_12770 [Acidobacteria bacterium]|nr:MAG: hypothetical protein DMG49_12770 [Acidobacteriota bacterium]